VKWASIAQTRPTSRVKKRRVTPGDALRQMVAICAPRARSFCHKMVTSGSLPRVESEWRSVLSAFFSRAPSLSDYKFISLYIWTGFERSCSSSIFLIFQFEISFLLDLLLNKDRPPQCYACIELSIKCGLEFSSQFWIHLTFDIKYQGHIL